MNNLEEFSCRDIPREFDNSQQDSKGPVQLHKAYRSACGHILFAFVPLTSVHNEPQVFATLKQERMNSQPKKPHNLRKLTIVRTVRARDKFLVGPLEWEPRFEVELLRCRQIQSARHNRHHTIPQPKTLIKLFAG